MNMHITSRQAPLGPELRAFCEGRLKEIHKLLDFATDVDVITSHERNLHKAEVHVQGKGGGLLIVEEDWDLEKALHRAFDGLEKKIKKEREKFRDKRRRGGRERKALTVPAEPVVPAEFERKIIRSSFYTAKPTSVEEAVVLFEARKKEVLMFRTEDEEHWAVLFRRKDGHIGLVEPE